MLYNTKQQNFVFAPVASFCCCAPVIVQSWQTPQIDQEASAVVKHDAEIYATWISQQRVIAVIAHDPLDATDRVGRVATARLHQKNKVARRRLCANVATRLLTKSYITIIIFSNHYIK